MWISPDCHGIVAVLVISGKQPSSGLLHTLRFICVCVWPLSAVCYNIASSSSHRGSTLVLPGTRSHVSPHRLTSTTQPLCHCARAYHNIHKTHLHAQGHAQGRNPQPRNQEGQHLRDGTRTRSSSPSMSMIVCWWEEQGCPRSWRSWCDTSTPRARGTSRWYSACKSPVIAMKGRSPSRKRTTLCRYSRRTAWGSANQYTRS